MWYGSTKTLLESVVRQLRTEAPHDDAEWQAQTDLVQKCLAEMTEMSQLVVHPLMARRYVHRPVANKLSRAVEHVRSMVTAMQQHDRTTALAHGETTLQRL
jgi:heme exporter protein D